MKRISSLALAITAFLLPAIVQAAQLTYEIRIDPATSSPGVTVLDAHSAAVSAPGDVVGISLYAVIANGDATHTNDGFLLAEGSFLATGALAGNLRGDTVNGGVTQQNNTTKFNGIGAQSGFVADLNGDSALDVGDLANTGAAPAVAPWFIAFGIKNGVPATIIGTGAGTDPTEFLIGRTVFTVGASALNGLATQINFVPRMFLVGPGRNINHFRVDGVDKQLFSNDPEIATVGASIVIGSAPPQVPIAGTGVATNVTATTATLNGTVNPNLSITTAKFQSGLTDTYGTDTAVTLTPNNGAATQSVSTTLTGLAPNKTYHFRVSAVNGVGPALGNDAVFTTSADTTAPTITAPVGGFTPLTLTTGANGKVALPDYTGQAVTHDDVGVTAVTQTPAAGLVNAGTTHVKLTAHDAAGNTADATFDVTVLDGTVPVITHAPDPQEDVADATGHAPVPNVTGDVTATDNVGVASITQVPLAGTSVGVGETNIVVTVADAAGNTATANASFTVFPAEAPADLGSGSYSGLLDDGVGGADGLVTLVVNSSGSFSGKILLPEKTKGFQGVFVNGVAEIGVGRFGTLALARDANGGINLTLGDLLGHAENSPFTLASPASLRGTYTMLLPPDPAHAGEAAFPQGTGFATLRVNRLGIVQCVGRVGDGAPFAFQSSVHGDGALPGYAGLYTAPRGSIGGTLVFRDLAGTDFSGALSWSKPPQTSGPNRFRIMQPAGFSDVSVPAIGSRYLAAATPVKMLNYSSLHRATVTFHDGGLLTPVSGMATVKAALPTAVTSPMLGLTFSPVDGTFVGTLQPGAPGGVPKPFFGVVFQKQNRGAGLFIGAGTVGGVDYMPQP